MIEANWHADLGQPGFSLSQNNNHSSYKNPVAAVGSRDPYSNSCFSSFCLIFFLFKKITDIKGTFHARMGTIKDRNGENQTEARD